MPMDEGEMEMKAGRANRKRYGGWVLAAAAGLMLLVAGCIVVSPPADQSTQLTQAALNAQATTLAMQAQQLTEQAGQQPPTQPVPPTQAPPVVPPTQAPPPTESPYVEGSMVRAAYDPAASWGAPNSHEDFDGTSGLFATGSSDEASSWYADGQYHITFTRRGAWTWYFGTPYTANFYSDIVVINGDQCVERDSGGMLVRMQQALDFGIMFGITCGGEYYIGVTWGPGMAGPVCMFTGSELSNPPLLSEHDNCVALPYGRESQYIDAGPGAANRLGVWAEGNQYKVYINGHHVDTFTDNWFYVTAGATKGYHSLFIGTGQKNNSAVSFDDFSLWKIY
jgi:hypothetical protein